ncbi:MAG: D-glycero-beta-D-manno-heptose 1-phosphate adenylyltransferase [Bacteroidales bacterium]|jgi:rfaE bifunctional protein nucleotidyltransferase chain/domain|nr:D-glycero-beta-D-manno-heptose 1-phosphate adenylyltransferase [Bacteroidales bacterium]
MTPIERINSKIFDIRTLKAEVARWKQNNMKIVFSNGCFDILHRGHIDYLAKAKALGDKMIIGVNSDQSVKRLKGNGRPLQDEQSRLMLLAAMEFVDAVVLFDDDTPYDLIKTLLPDVLVKGADYQPSQIAGYDIVTANGGKVETIAFLDGFSTSNIVRKAQSLANTIK